MWTTLLAIVILLAFVAIVAALVRRPEPWAVPEAERSRGPDRTVRRLQEKKEKVLRRIKDLDLEKESGATTDEEYHEMRRSFVAEAAVLNRRLAELQGKTPAAAPPPLPGEGRGSEVPEDADTPRPEGAATDGGGS